MPSAGRILLLPALSKAVLVHTAPTLSFPINSQVPPVARIGELFSFSFSDSTFTSSDGSSLSYALSDPPSWLSLDSNARQLHGTPQDEDIAAGTVVGVNITLVARDSTGPTSDDATLVVSRNPAPTVQIPISEQMHTFGTYSNPSSILCSPEENFKFRFASNTFSHSSVLNYYSVLVDNSPLPAWLSFDAGTLVFAGTTPPFSSLVEPPQTFSVKLIASDVTGFSATSVTFSIVVGSHTLTTSEPDITLNATAGEPLSYGGLMGTIQMDGQVAEPSQVNVTTEGLPSWLSFDPASWNISGTPPDSAQSATFTVLVGDAYTDSLNVTVGVQLTTSDSLFQSTFPALTVKPGGSFSFALGSYLLDPEDSDVTTNVQPATSWIYWDVSSLTLSGDAPSSAQKSMVNVTFTVVSRSSTEAKRTIGAGQSQELIIQIESVAESTTATGVSTTSQSSSPTASSTSTTAAAPADKTSASQSIKWTVVAVVISAVALIAIIASLCFWYCNRRKNKRHSRSTLSSGPYPESTFIHTPGHPVGSPEAHSTTSPNEKEKSKKATTVWKASNLRKEPEPSPAPAGFGFGALYNDDHLSVVSTPRGKIKDWFASMRSLRVIHVLPSNRRTSTDSSLPDEGRSHHGFDLESATPPPVISLSHGSQTSFRDALEVALPTHDSSLQLTPETAYSASQRRMSRRISKGKTTQGLLIPGSNGPQQKDPFTDIHVIDSISPISEHNPDPEPFNAHHISPLTPTDPESSVAIPSSSVLPTTRPLRPAHSQKSFASSASSSIDSLRGHSRKFARKASAHAKGAIFALQSPKRRTYAALGKQRSAGKRRRRAPVLEDDESAITAGTRSVSSPTASSFKPGSRSGGGGIAGFLSPRVWPQPGVRNVTVPQSRAEYAGAMGDGGVPQQAAPIRRRPVPGAGVDRGSGSGDSGTESIAMPLPLRTPVRTGNSKNYSKASPYGLGILDVCNEIASSSPYGPSPASLGSSSAPGSGERNWKVIGESPGVERGWERSVGEEEEVGRAIGGEEGHSVVIKRSVTGVSDKSKASSGGDAFV